MNTKTKVIIQMLMGRREQIKALSRNCDKMNNLVAAHRYNGIAHGLTESIKLLTMMEKKNVTERSEDFVLPN